MNRREFLATLTVAGDCIAQPPAIPWVCPMDPDVRSQGPAKCPKCGMALVAGIPQPREFAVDLRTSRLRPNVPVEMRFRVLDPATGKPAKLQIIHEKLFHLFLVSADLEFFAHEHPELQRDGTFLFTATLPRPGEYRVLSDFYPEGGTPQMIARSIIVPGPPMSPAVATDHRAQRGKNLQVRLRTEPAQPLAGKKTMLFLDLDPFDGIEQYLGAWGHMLVASADLIDMVHQHPAWEEITREVQFNVIFPRPGLHRVWVQFQRRGVVNTVAFWVAVHAI